MIKIVYTPPKNNDIDEKEEVLEHMLTNPDTNNYPLKDGELTRAMHYMIETIKKNSILTASSDAFYLKETLVDENGWFLGIIEMTYNRISGC